MPVNETLTPPLVLFVDDEPEVLDAIRRVLSLHDQDWDTEFAYNGKQALELMEKRPADVVVTDMAMPIMDGKELIDRLSDRFPAAVPVILSGHWNESSAFAQFGPRARYLSKPVSSELLAWTVRQAIFESRSNSISTQPMGWSQDLARLIHRGPENCMADVA